MVSIAHLVITISKTQWKILFREIFWPCFRWSKPRGWRAWFAPRMLPTPLKETHRRIVGNCLLVVPTSGRARKVSWHLQWPHCCDPNIWPWFCKVAKTSNVVSPFRLRYWILVRLELAHYNAPGQIPFSFKKLQDTFHGNIPRCFSRIATFRPTPSSGLPFSSIAKSASSCTHVPLRLPWAQRIHVTQNHLRNGWPPEN